MARAQDQKRWRDKSDRKRIEVYLPVDSVTALDALTAESGQSRSAAIMSLIAAQRETNQAATQPAYQLRRPRAGPEQRYEWILVVDGEPLAGLKRDSFRGWRGSYLKPSMFSRPCQRTTRDEVALELILKPDLCR